MLFVREEGEKGSQSDNRITLSLHCAIAAMRGSRSINIVTENIYFL